VLGNQNKYIYNFGETFSYLEIITTYSLPSYALFNPVSTSACDMRDCRFLRITAASVQFWGQSDHDQHVHLCAR
jgi:hypothetical protein